MVTVDVPVRLSTVDVLCPVDECRTVIHIPVMAQHVNDTVDAVTVCRVVVWTDDSNAHAHAMWHREELEATETLG